MRLKLPLKERLKNYKIMLMSYSKNDKNMKLR